MSETPAAIVLAERVASAARDLGIETALIGAVALAANNYIRATDDADLASCVDPYTKLAELEKELAAMGLRTELRHPDDDDPLGGVLRVWEREDADGEPLDKVDVVNFWNPHRPTGTPAMATIKNALPLGEGSVLRYARLADLVAMKLYTGGRRDEADVVDLLVMNPSADVEEVRSVAKGYGFDRIDTLIEEATATLSRQRR